MCVVCLEFQKGTLTKFEAQNAALELIAFEQIDYKHLEEISDLLEKKDVE